MSPRREPICLHHFFEHQVARVPDAIAAEHAEVGERLTYRELDARATRLAWALHRRGVGPNDRVGIHLPRGLDLYVAMLGILKAGAAYVPIDLQLPEERVRFMLEDSGARAVLTSEALASRVARTPAEVLRVEDPALLAPPEGAQLPTPSPEDLCYVIYTSGTTGKPKGVGISHLNAVTYVRGMLEAYGVRSDDRILQGFSTAFDASIEEIWMAFATGATLVVGTLEAMQAADELRNRLRELGITVFSTLPSLLAVVDSEDLPGLRLLITGGEVARADVIEKWSAPGRAILNTYGPTETTVVATYAWCAPGAPVTIGKPLPGYAALVLDPERREVGDGKKGELCIGGPAVSLVGYLNRPELNEQKFFERDGQRFCRTGDLVHRAAQGDLVYLGRLDAQVKIRGYRVELEEIETHISRALDAQRLGDAFLGGIVALKNDASGTPQLVAYLLECEPADVNAVALVAELRKHLPPYMVPAHFVRLRPSAVPRLPSGKVDRRALPEVGACAPLGAASAVGESPVEPDDGDASDAERQILRIWRAVLGHRGLRRDDSFFDFGGHSILAAQAISRFREDRGLSLLTIRDMYQHATSRALAQRLGERLAARQTAGAALAAGRDEGARLPYRAPRAQFRRVALAQSLTLLAMVAAGAYAAYGALCAVTWLGDRLAELTPHWPWLLAGGLVVAALAAMFAVPLGLAFVARGIAGRLEPGDHNLWSWGYFRWWFANALLAPLRGVAGAFLGTPVAPVLYRLLGARIGRAVYLASPLDGAELVTLEDGASISAEVIFRTHAIEGGILRLRRIHVGRNAFVGAHSVLGGGVRLGDGSKVHPLTCLAPDFVAPPASEWRGSPATSVAPGETALSRLLARHEAEAPHASPWASRSGALPVVAWQAFYAATFAALLMVPYELEVGLMTLLGFASLSARSVELSVLLSAAVPFAALRFFGGLGAVLLAKRLLAGGARAGTISLGSREYARRWLTDRLMAYLVDSHGLRGVTETLLMPHVCRWLGMRVGRKCEISDASGFQPDLVSIGEGAMLGDHCSIGVPVVHRGLMTLGHVHVGDRSFVGNAAHLPITTPELRPRSLVGVRSIPPDDPPADSDWLGSPPMRLPNRARWEGPTDRTFDPPTRLLIARCFFNFWKMVLPSALHEMMLWLALAATFAAETSLSTPALLAVLPLIALGIDLAMLALPVALKWMLIGRYPAGQRYLWSFWMWRGEIVYEVERHVASTYHEIIGGTPLLPLWYRAMGARIGRQVCIHNGVLMEADLVTIGDHVSVEGFLQTHLFEDRVMKLGHVHLKDGCSVGREGCVQYDSSMGENSSLGDLSLIMKHEHFVPTRRYRGLPAENVHVDVG